MQLPLPFSHLLQPRHVNLTQRQLTRIKNSSRSAKIWRKDSKPWQRNQTIIDRINQRTTTDTETGCVLWLGAVTARGYSKLLIDGHNHSVHRLVYELFNGPIDPGKQINHKCGVKRCVNVSHLESLTPTEHNALTPRQRRRSQRLICCLEDGRVYKNACEAARAYGIDAWSIRAAARGLYKAALGKHFAYV